MTFLQDKLFITRTVIPAGVAFIVPSHYHLAYDEYFAIEVGHIEVTCDGVSTVVSSADGEFKAPGALGIRL